MRDDAEFGPDLLRNWIDRAADHDPDKAYVISIDDRRSINYRQLKQLTQQIAIFLAKRGIKANDRIALLAGNSIEHLVCYIGVMAYGATICTIHVEMNRNHIAQILPMLEPRLALFDTGLQLSKILADESTPSLPLVSLNGCNEEGFFDLVAGCELLDTKLAVTRSRDDACILFTSGTSARPKGVVLTFRELLSNVEPTADGLGMTSNDRIYDFRSFNWCSAQVLSALAPLSRGATLVLGRKFTRSRYFQIIADYGVTITAGNPTTINMLLNGDDPTDAKALSGLRFIISSSAPLLREDWLRFEQRFGVPIAQSYGCSEIGWIATNPGSDRHLDTVGQPAPYLKLAIVDERGQPLPVGTIGQVEVGGFPDNDYRYIADDGTIRVHSHGRLRTGDIGFLDEVGYLHLTGREKDLIIRGGINISPLEIDGVLLQRPEIIEVATIGVPDRTYGEEVVSFVVMRPGATIEVYDLLRHCSKFLPASKTPKEIVLSNHLPKTVRGKLDRRALTEQWIDSHPNGMPEPRA